MGWRGRYDKINISWKLIAIWDDLGGNPTAMEGRQGTRDLCDVSVIIFVRPLEIRTFSRVSFWGVSVSEGFWPHLHGHLDFLINPLRSVGCRFIFSSHAGELASGKGWGSQNAIRNSEFMDYGGGEP